MLRPSWTREWGSEGMIGAIKELDYFSALIRLRELDKSEDKAKGGTFVESLIPYSQGGRSLAIKGAEEVESAEANSKYQQGKRVEAKEFYKTDVDGLLIKIAKSERLRVDAGVLNQGTK
ncbi:hypothetical protein GW17_00061201 [Ensete ventricosum]|nr:hypothetical protein GW17_00061201 [Ensete ventricosum]